IPIAAYEALATVRAVCALAPLVTDVSGVNEVESNLAGNVTGHRQRGRTRRGQVCHLVVWMEGREVQRHIWPKPIHHPFAQLFDLLRAIVETWDEQRRNLEPHLRLALEIFERLKDRAESPAAQALVERLGEGFEVDIGRVHPGVKLFPGSGGDV